MTRIHMQDQIQNRIAELMNEKNTYDWDAVFQDAATFSVIMLFMALGLNW